MFFLATIIFFLWMLHPSDVALLNKVLERPNSQELSQIGLNESTQIKLIPCKYFSLARQF